MNSISKYILIILFVSTGCKTPIQNDIILKKRLHALEKINAYSLRRLNITQGMGCTILHTAVIANDVDVVKALIKRKVDIDKRTQSIKSEGLTALHLAVLDRNIEIVRLLLLAGADKYIKYNGLSSVDLAKSSSNKDLMDLIENETE
tara:strand:- start:204 stop:644 length:441 start_codon:yes stop_codon:yes gene_type:complete